jgi:putative PIN family toxin of toxin-antitoxin system
MARRIVTSQSTQKPGGVLRGLRVVLDTNVIVAGLRSRQGASYRVLRRLGDDAFCLLLSVPLLLEYESVLKREQQQLASGLTPAQIDTLLDFWCARAEPVRLHYLWRPQLKDADDEMVLEAAVNGRADAILTHNTADFEPARLRFQVKIWTPAEFLLRLSKRP